MAMRSWVGFEPYPPLLAPRAKSCPQQRGRGLGVSFAGKVQGLSPFVQSQPSMRSSLSPTPGVGGDVTRESQDGDATLGRDLGEPGVGGLRRQNLRLFP
jgi:hypothetical protein